MFEPNMDEYLDEEVENVKQCFEVTCRGWNKNVRICLTVVCVIINNLSQLSQQTTSPANAQEQARFISSHNPAQVKRNVLASFTDVLLLPVTIVPRTTVAVGRAVGAALTTGGTAAVQGISMLNPQRWGAAATHRSTESAREGYVDFAKGTDTTLFDVGVDDDEDEDKDEDDNDNEKVPEASKSEKHGMRCMAILLSLGLVLRLTVLFYSLCVLYGDIHYSTLHKPFVIVRVNEGVDTYSSLCVRIYCKFGQIRDAAIS